MRSRRRLARAGEEAANNGSELPGQAAAPAALAATAATNLRRLNDGDGCTAAFACDSAAKVSCEWSVFTLGAGVGFMAWEGGGQTQAGPARGSRTTKARRRPATAGSRPRPAPDRKNQFGPPTGRRAFGR